jgi:hypothetical protein
MGPLDGRYILYAFEIIVNLKEIYKINYIK